MGCANALAAERSGRTLSQQGPTPWRTAWPSFYAVAGESEFGDVMPAQQQPSRGVSLRNRVRYRFDNLLSRGTWAALLFLAGVTLAGVLAASVVMVLFSATFAGSEDGSWLEDSWQSLMRVLDPGTMADDVGWGIRLVALLVTVFGILVAGTLIGLVATGIEQRVSELRRGRSTVVESGHIVILGASARLPVVIEQLALANRRRRRNVIVVLAKSEPDTLWDDVRAYADSLYSTRLVFRWGDPTRASDLTIVNVRQARAVIVLSHDETQADAGAVTAVLATGAALGGFDRIPIVVDLNDPETAKSLARALWRRGPPDRRSASHRSDHGVCATRARAERRHRRAAGISRL